MKEPPPTNVHEFIKDLEEDHIYVVEVSFRKGNPVHNTVLFTGFKPDGKVGGYWYLFNNNSGVTSLSHGQWPRYIKVLRDVGTL
jgi:hypothetical protein